ncbi:MAG: sulfotransferase domain-containing protein [Zetaproteobacteria bacterium]|nr:sulfotransferase domain-containing protein [Zetaproteobacteria bacterium]
MNIFLNSLPKSGTNMVQKLFHLSNIPYSKRSVAASSCFGRYGTVKKVLRQPCLNDVPVAIGLEVPVAVSPRWLQRCLRGAKGYVSGHAAYSASYQSILEAENFKVIQVVRHPASVLVSWANYIAESGYYWKQAHTYLTQMDIEERVRFLLYGGCIDGNLKLYYKGFKDVLLQVEGWVESKGVLTVRFEDLVGGQGGGSDEVQRETIQGILNHIEYDYQAEDLDRLQKDLFGGTHTFRGGQVDGWKQALSDKLIEQISNELSYISYLSKLKFENYR